MATKYADRVFITVNGIFIADVQSATLRQNRNAKPVPSMTRTPFNRGFTEGNRDIDITLQIAVDNSLARPKLDQIDYANSDVQIGWQCGADLFVNTGVFLKDSEDGAGGIGDEVKTTFNFGALALTDAVGNSSLFDINF